MTMRPEQRSTCRGWLRHWPICALATRWSFEVENEHGTSTVWGDLFATDYATHAAFRQTVHDEGMRAFPD